MGRMIVHHDEIREYMIHGDLQGPISVDMDLTDACNNRCPKCSTTMLYKTAGKEHKIARLCEKLAVATLEELYRYGTKSIVFTGGGEPLLHPEFHTIFLFSAARFDISIKTNGLLIDKYTEELLNAKWVRVSLDASNKETYKKTHGVDFFDKVCVNIENFSKHKDKTTLGIGFLIGSETIGEVEEGIKLARNLGADYIQLRPFSDWLCNDSDEEFLYHLIDSESTENFKVLFPNQARYKKKYTYNKCHAVHMCPKICANGDVFACCARKDSEVYLGNLNKDSFEKIWRNKKVDSINLKKCLDICRHHDKNIEIDSIIEAFNNNHRNFI